MDAFLAGEVGGAGTTFAASSKTKESLKEEPQTAGQTASKPKENAEVIHQVHRPSKSRYSLTLNSHKKLQTFVKDFPCTDISHEQPVDACTFQHKRVVVDKFTGATWIVHKGCVKYSKRVGGWLTSDQLQEVAAIVKALKEVDGAGGVVAQKHGGGGGTEETETITKAATAAGVKEPKVSISATHRADSITSQHPTVIPMTKCGTKWFSVDVGKKVDDAVLVEGVKDDDWEAVDAEEAVESEYVLV